MDITKKGPFIHSTLLTKDITKNVLDLLTKTMPYMRT